MKRGAWAVAALLCATAPAFACGLGTTGIAPLNKSGWTLDVVTAVRQWDGGTLRLPEPNGQPIKTSASTRSLKLPYYGGDRRLRRQKRGLAAALTKPIGADIRSALDATGVAWQACDASALPVFGYTEQIHKSKVMQVVMMPLSENRAAAVRWEDEKFPEGVRALSREIMVLKR